MKIMFINGSPRKNWNTDILMKKALEGAVSAGAEAEMVYLYDLKFRGCVSCMACKLKKEPRPNRCIQKDDQPCLKSPSVPYPQDKENVPAPSFFLCLPLSYMKG